MSDASLHLPGIMSADGAAVRARRRLWRPANIVIAISATLIIIIFAIFGALCVQAYSTITDQAKTRTQAAADIVAEEAEWLVGGTRATLQALANMVQDPAHLSDASRTGIDGALKALPVGTSFGLYDSTGAAYPGEASPSLPSIAATDLMQQLQNGDFAVSKQLTDAASGKPIFALAQKLPGNVPGIAVLAVSADVMQEIWAPQNLGRDSTTSLLREDGWLVARYPALPAAIQSNQFPLFNQQKDLTTGTYVAQSPIDGVMRVVAFHRLPTLGIIAITSISRDSAFAGLWSSIITVLWLMGPIAIALFIGSLMTARILNQSDRIQANLAAALAHNDVLFREIHHRVKNNLQSVGALLQMQAIPRDIKANMGQRIAAMAAVHEHIYRSSNFESVRAKDYLATLIENIRGGSSPNLTVVEDLDDLSVDKDAATPLGLIVNEAVSNAFKHAFPEGRRGTITVRLKREGTDRGRLVVEDDGVGYDAATPATGIGQRLIRALTSQLGGESEVTTQPGKGSHFTVSFPLARKIVA